MQGLGKALFENDGQQTGTCLSYKLASEPPAQVSLNALRLAISETGKGVILSLSADTSPPYLVYQHIQLGYFHFSVSGHEIITS